MSRLIRLYPATWRARYDTELLELLAERPLAPGDSIDLLRGVIDAHLHPEVMGDEARPWTHRLPGLFAGTAGLIWSWYVVRAYLAAPGDEWGEAIGMAILLMLISLPGDYMADYGRRIAMGIGLTAAAVVLARALPWSVGDGLLNAAAGLIGYLLLGGGMLSLAAIRAGVGPVVRWALVALAVLAPAAIGVPILVGVGPQTRDAALPLLFTVLPYGIAWTLIGLRMTLRGSQTVVDSPNETGPAAQAA
jgi:hypothetical protein